MASKKILSVILFLTALCGAAQQNTAPAKSEGMAELFFSEGKVYVVVVVVSMVVVGMLIYLFLLDKKINKLEKIVNDKE